jgi:hypothetical protein
MSLWNRLREILGRQPMGQVELLLVAESVALLTWMLTVGGDCTFNLLREQLALLVPSFETGRVVMVVILAVNVLRVWAVLKDRLMLRCWIARFSCFGWLVTLLTYFVVQVSANELPVYFVGALANFWVAVRLDERGIRQRALCRSSDDRD